MPRGIKGFQKGNKIGIGNTHGFKKGLAPWNKGLKYSKELKAVLNTEGLKKGWGWGKGMKRPEQSGKNNPNWKGGFNGVQNKRWCPEYKEWRLKVFKRDAYVCQKCKNKGSRKNPLHAHHIIKFSDSLEFAFDVNNGITVCRNCHLKIHTKKGSTH